MNVAIHCSEHVMLAELCKKNFLVLNNEIELKLLFHRFGSTGWLALYGMTEIAHGSINLGVARGVTCWGLRV